MNYELYREQLVCARFALMEILGQRGTDEEVIYFVPEWHHKWAEAMRGRCDA